MQRKKNIRLLLIFLALAAWTIIFLNLGERKSRIDIDENLFAVKDTTLIQNIRIRKSGNTITLEKVYGEWKVNGTYGLDPSMRKVLLAVLNQVKVKRAVPANKSEKITRQLKQKGALVEIEFEDKTTFTFLAGGNGISLSYFMVPEQKPYIVYLPGYESYVAGIFDVSVNDWRDRLIFQTSWLGLKELTLIYPENPSNNVFIRPDKNLYHVENTTTLDTASLMNYIDQVSYFFVDQYISTGQIPVYDSLASTIPKMILTVNAVSMKVPINIKFFEALPNEKVRLGVINDKQLCLFRNNRIEYLFKTKKDFSGLNKYP